MHFGFEYGYRQVVYQFSVELKTIELFGGVSGFNLEFPTLVLDFWVNEISRTIMIY